MLRNRAAKILNEDELKEYILDTVHKIEKQYSRLTDQEYLSLFDTLSRIHFRGKEQAMPEGYAYVGKQFEAFEGDDKKGQRSVAEYISFKPDDFHWPVPPTGLKISNTGVILSGPARGDNDDSVENKYKHWPTEMNAETIEALIGLYPGLSPIGKPDCTKCYGSGILGPDGKKCICVQNEEPESDSAAPI